MVGQEQIDRLWGSLLKLGSRRLIALGVIGISVFAVTGLAGYFLSRPETEVLYAGLDRQDVGRIAAALREADIPFDVNSDGNTDSFAMGKRRARGCALIAKDDPGEALRLLDKARVMLPGTLIEEAALRRALILTRQMADIEKFAYLSSEYIWRFPKSEYFESFRQQFASAVVQFSLADDSKVSHQTGMLIAMLDPSSQLPLYLQIGYRGIIVGKAGAALAAAAKAKQLSESGSTERARADLYEAAALSLTGHLEAAIEELNTVDLRRLPRQDRELKEAAAALAKMISDAGANASEPFVPEVAQATNAFVNASTGSNSVSTLIDLAHLKLAESDEMLQRKSP